MFYNTNEQLNEQNGDKILYINSNSVIANELMLYGYASAGTGEIILDDVQFKTQYQRLYLTMKSQFK